MSKKNFKHSEKKAYKEKEYKDLVLVNGVITEAYPNAVFDVELENGQTVRLPISGKMRRNNIRLVLGCKVIVGLSTYDLTKGRILFRL